MQKKLYHYRDPFDFKPLCLVLALFVACWLLGCATRPAGRVPIPETPSTSPTAGSVVTARANTVAAQSNVRAGTVEAKADRGPAAVPFLVKADSQLSDALAALAAATSHVAELEASIKASDAAYQQNLAALNTDLGNATAAGKKLAAENDKLRNEVLRQAKLRIGAVGAFLLVASIGFIVAAIWAQFPLGFKLAPICFAMGSAALALASMLSKIILGAEILLGLGVLAALGFGAYELLQHIPPKVAEKLATAQKEVEEFKTQLARRSSTQETARG